jgi:hypothetical protein
LSECAEKQALQVAKENKGDAGLPKAFKILLKDSAKLIEDSGSVVYRL